MLLDVRPLTEDASIRRHVWAAALMAKALEHPGDDFLAFVAGLHCARYMGKNLADDRRRWNQPRAVAASRKTRQAEKSLDHDDAIAAAREFHRKRPSFLVTHERVLPLFNARRRKRGKKAVAMTTFQNKVISARELKAAVADL
jgi:hypothetical protein